MFLKLFRATENLNLDHIETIKKVREAVIGFPKKHALQLRREGAEIFTKIKGENIYGKIRKSFAK